MPDVQDGYGLMISELLGSDSPNCSSVPTDLNSLHNHMGLPNSEVMVGSSPLFCCDEIEGLNDDHASPCNQRGTTNL